MKIKLIIISFLLLAISASSCKQREKADQGSREDAASSVCNGIYYWKTVFRLTEKDSTFLRDNGIARIYLRMFDVDKEYPVKYPGEAIPVGTLRLESKTPAEIEIVPTVFITLQALSLYDGREDELAKLITKRMMAMCSFNDIEGVKEFQFDCDWTESSKASYVKLCEAAKEILHPLGISLSGTIRLHQIEEAIYPFDRGVVMLYNTGAIKDPETGNSIISFTDVNKYLSVSSRVKKFNDARKKNCPVIDFAYPTFCWGVCYDDDGRFDGIVRSLEFDSLPWLEKQGGRYYVKESGEYDGQWFNKGQFIRAEYSDLDEVLKVKELVDRTICQENSSSIIFHLDQKNVSKYKKDEISKILR